MRRLAQLGFFLVVGLALAYLFKVDVDAVAHSPAYEYLAFTLLAIGLYSGTYGIEPADTLRDGRLILTAVTVGVVVKALLIGGLLVLAFQNPIFWVLAIAVAQVDPLAVAALMSDSRMSPRVKTILAAWSSFDDPITVLLAIYLAALLSINHPSAMGWFADLAANLVLAAVTIGLCRLVPRAWVVALPVALGVAIAGQWMLAVALIGFFCAPRRLAGWIPRLTAAALAGATILLGMVLKGGVDPLPGIALGLATYAAHFVVAWVLTRRLPRRDRIHLSLAQQNGITAIILALALQIDIDFAVAVIAPAILVVNLTHLVANHLYDRRAAVGNLPYGEIAAGSGAGESDSR
jgi:NhaP-type Na+/H+ or K+/H+ antiporter